MIFRSTTASELDTILPMLEAGKVGAWVGPDAYRKGLEANEYRPEHSWIAEAGDGAPLALALWWAPPEARHPAALDTVVAHPSLDTDTARTDTVAALLDAAHRAFAADGLTTPPEYHVMLPADWADQPEAVAALAWRREAARRAGLAVPVERLRFEWTADAGIPVQSGRLRFRPEPDDEVFVDLFRRVLEGTLDAASRKEAAELGAEPQARSDVAFYRDSMVGERDWWRVAETPDGEVVGFGLPSRNTVIPVVGYLGVLPEHRGHGHVDDILAEITRYLAEEVGVETIRADTDLGNRPMAESFARSGYRNFARRLVLSSS